MTASSPLAYVQCVNQVRFLLPWCEAQGALQKLYARVIARLEKMASRGKPRSKALKKQVEARAVEATEDQSEGPTAPKKRTRKVLSKKKSKGSKRQVKARAVELTEDQSEDPTAPKKRTRKVLSKKERENFVKCVNNVDTSVLTTVVSNKLREQSYFSENLTKLVDTLFADNHKLVEDILTNHRAHFGELYLKCKHEVDPYLKFQLQWQQYCSAFLLSRSYSLNSINLEKYAEESVAAVRMQWLDFCDRSGIPVPESNPVMITISSAVYELLLGHAESFQTSLNSNGECAGTTTQCSSVVTDGEDVHLRFGGAAICEMLHLHYKQIKECTDMQRDKLSQEITILQAMVMKDKSNLPHYLKYRDRGFMYFPDVSFVPFLQMIHETIRQVVSISSLEENTIEVSDV